MEHPDPFGIRILAARRDGALAGITLDVRRGECLALLGPRGSGKTALLRAVAGHDRIDEGVIYLAGADVTHAPPRRRPVNLVSRRPVLFPHLTVEGNIAFGLSCAAISPAEQVARVAEIMETMNLAGLENETPARLTIDQAQRVCLARALVLRNPVMLLDDCLSELDPPNRREIAGHLKDVQQRTGLTLVLATRDAGETLGLADRFVVLNRGAIEQIGAATEVFERPRTALAAGLVGTTNFMIAHVTRSDGAIVTVASPAGFEAVILRGEGKYQPGDAVRFLVRPERFELRRAEPDPGQALAYMEVTLEERVGLGQGIAWIVRNRAGERLEVRQTSAEGELVVMGKAWLCWDPRNAVMISG